MVETFNKLTDYTLALREGLESTEEASERPLITGRLAGGSLHLAAAHQGSHETIHTLG